MSGIYYANIDPNTIKVETFNNTKKLWEEIAKTTYTIEVVPLVVNYAPCKIEIKPKTTAVSRVYGATDADASFGIDFDVIYPVGFPESKKMTGNSNIKGKFVRGKYNNDGTFMSFGTRFDMATDANGNVLDKSGFYAIAVGTDFVTTNTNFNLVVDKNAIKNTKLSISPAKIYMQESNLKGKNKNYDGNNTVFYNDGEAYDITKILLRANDDVKLAFTAKYQSVLSGVANKIVFTKIYLEGSASMNYVLYVGDEATGVLVDFNTTTFTIAKLNNSIADATDGNLIKILK
ncbi:MAG: YDG domain-containing protein, partial [Clostridia bacterium]